MTSSGAAPQGAAAAVLHVDMDAFFVSVELLRRPELRGRPVVVGGAGPRGVVAAASYEARAFGVHSAMPSVRARRLCPQATFLPGDHAHYRAASERVMAIFRSFTPLVEPISLDEAFLDVAGARRLFGAPSDIAASLRAQVLDQEGLTCSVGIARVKFLAKLASEAAKPVAAPTGPRPGRGIVEVEPERELDFLHPMPVRALWGVGPATLRRLERLGVRTIGDLAALPLDAVVGALGPAAGGHLHALAHARDGRSVEPDQRARSISHEETYPRDLRDETVASTEVTRLADAVGSRLREAGESGRTVTLKVRFGDFSTITRSSTVAEPLDSGRRIARIARDLLAAVDISAGVRLLGVAVSHFDGGGARQLTLDVLGEPSGAPGAPDGPAGWDDAEDAISAVRARFGPASLGPASIAGPSGLRTVERGGQQWGPDAAPPSDG